MQLLFLDCVHAGCWFVQWQSTGGGGQGQGHVTGTRFFLAGPTMAGEGGPDTVVRAYVAADHDILQRRHTAEQADVLERTGDADLGHTVHGIGSVGMAVDHGSEHGTSAVNSCVSVDGVSRHSRCFCSRRRLRLIGSISSWYGSLGAFVDHEGCSTTARRRYLA